MRNFILCILASLLSTTGHAAADYTVTWNLPVLTSVGMQPKYNVKLVFDLNLGTELVAANGGARYANGNTVPITGTCFVTQSGGVYCAFPLGLGALGLLEVGSNLNGTWRAVADGNTIESADAVFYTIK